MRTWNFGTEELQCRSNPKTEQLDYIRNYVTEIVAPATIKHKEDQVKFLQFIHGREETSRYGAWEYLVTHASREIIELLGGSMGEIVLWEGEALAIFLGLISLY